MATTIAKRYRVVAQLGAGGAGAVYKAVDLTLRRIVAVKLLHPGKEESQQTLQRFYREARKASQLSHPHSVTVHDFGRTDDETFYLVMEYLRGLSLKQVLAQQGALAPGRAVHIMRQVCDSLGEAHGLGIIHRDLKPDNIFLTAKGEQRDVVKLVDFGLAKTVGSQTDFVTRHGTPGTPNYMSPEQIQQGDVDSRSDLYSLGAVMYSMLTGTHVFPGKRQVMELLWAHVSELPVPPSERQPQAGISESLEAVVLKLLAKDKADRYQTAAEVKAALEAPGIAPHWTDPDAVAAWADLELPPDDDVDVMLEHGRPATTDGVGAAAGAPVTIESTGLRSAYDGDAGQDDRTRQIGPPASGVPWPLLVAVSVGVAVVTALVVVLLLKTA